MLGSTSQSDNDLYSVQPWRNYTCISIIPPRYNVRIVLDSRRSIFLHFYRNFHNRIGKPCMGAEHSLAFVDECFCDDVNLHANQSEESKIPQWI
jgi:hypothetical protein